MQREAGNLVSLPACTDTYNLSELHLLWLLCPLKKLIRQSDSLFLAIEFLRQVPGL
jgi:hypothetical protein